MTPASYSRAAEGGGTRPSPLGVFDDPRYAQQIAVGRAKEYQSAAPFPNICIDDFLPENVARALRPPFQGLKTSPGWSVTTRTIADGTNMTRPNFPSFSARCFVNLTRDNLRSFSKL